MRAQISAAAHAAGRDPEEITLIAVSKTQSAVAVRAAFDAGLRDFGENYLQEAVDKVAACEAMGARWHFIGALQSNKTRPVATNFHWVHTVDRGKIARRLASQRPSGRTLKVCLQVNVDADPNKAGVTPEKLPALLDEALGCEGLEVRGLMAILHPDTEPARGYGTLRELFEQLRGRAGPRWDALSMGMSGDFEAAIAAGATHVRVGTAIFGPRQPKPEAT